MDSSSPVRRDDPRILSIQVGRIAPLGAQRVPSGFVKSAVSGPVRVDPLGLQGDEQADLTVHGGADKAIYFYPFEHYASWARDVPRHERALVPGAFGENVTTKGLDESSVSIGDVFRIGSTEIQVTQPRQPCFKLALRFGDARLGRLMLQTGRTGWYVRVLVPGAVEAGDEIRRLRRPNPGWTIARFNDLILGRGGTPGDQAQLATLEGLAEGWKQVAREGLRDDDEV